MGERLTWSEIKKRYPHQNVGLIDIEQPSAGETTAVVKYTSNDLSYSDMVHKAFAGEIHMRYTTLDEDLPIIL